MKKHKKTFIIIALVILLLLVVYFGASAANYLLNKKNGTAAPADVVIASIQANATPVNNTLAIGSTGDEVKALQQLLNTMPPLIPVLAVDGNFGTRTEAKLNAVTGAKAATLQQLIDFINNKAQQRQAVSFLIPGL